MIRWAAGPTDSLWFRRQDADAGSAGVGRERSRGACPREVGRLRAVELDHCVIAVSDWERSTRFYTEVLGAELVGLDHGRFAYRFGEQQLNVHGPGSTPHPRAIDPVRPGNSDLCFRWDGSAEAAAAHLAAHGVEVELGPVGRQGARGPGRSVYFRDPDGALLELIAYD